jgi:hypothetical protein
MDKQVIASSNEINKPTKRNLGHLVVSMHADLQVIRIFARQWPGYLKRASAPSPKGTWVWTIAARRAKSFLEVIYPYVIRTRTIAKINLGLRFQRAKKPGRGNRTPAYSKRQWQAYRAMAVLNERDTWS